MNKRSRNSGFTIVELTVVVAVLAILSTVIALGFLSTQKESRDSESNSKITVVVEALENYYAVNGEYPSVAAMRSNDANSIGTLLKLEDVNVLVMPHSSSSTTNSFSKVPPAATSQPTYTGLPNTAICQTNANGGCTSYTITWVPEVSGTATTVNSRRG